MQSKSKPFDDLSNLMTNAMGAFKGVGDEVKAMGRARAEGLIADMDLVGRDEFEAFKKVIQAQHEEIQSLKAQMKALSPTAKKTPARKAKAAPAKRTAAKKTTAKKKAPTKAKTKAKTAKPKTAKSKTTKSKSA